MEPEVVSMPPAETIPGAWPAHVLMATTSGLPSLPDDESAAGATPEAPLPFSGSGGAFLRASKSCVVSLGFAPGTAGAGVGAAPAQLLMAPPLYFQPTYPITPRMTTVTKNLANG